MIHMTYRVEVRYSKGHTLGRWGVVGFQYKTIKGARKDLYKSLVTPHYEGRIISNKSRQVIGIAVWEKDHKTQYQPQNKLFMKEIYELKKDGSIKPWKW